MKAAVIREFNGPITIENVQVAEPSDNEVKVRIAACAVCHSDLWFHTGGALTAKPPMILGHEAAGVVESVGPGVTNVKPGDHVVVTLIASCGHCHTCVEGHHVHCESVFPLDRSSPFKDAAGEPVQQGIRTGAFAEYTTVNASQVCAIPKDISLVTASLMGCGVITGLGAVWNSARMPVGANVAIIGLGGVGLNAVQGAAIGGAKTIIGIDISDEKGEISKSFGATHALNARDNDLAQKVKDLTEGRGVEYVFVTVGSKVAIEQAQGLMAKLGKAYIIGLADSKDRAEYSPVGMVSMGQTIAGSKMGEFHIGIDIPKVVSLYKQGRLKLDELVSKTYKLEEINEAFKSTKTGSILRNVIVFD